MLHLILNYNSVHDCVDFLKSKGFHDNSFVIGPLYEPTHLNILNLPKKMLEEIIETLKSKLAENPQGYLKNSYENLIKYYTTTPWKKNIEVFHYHLGKMDQRRNLNARLIFDDLFKELDVNTLE